MSNWKPGERLQAPGSCLYQDTKVCGYVCMLRVYRFYLFLKKIIGFWNCSEGVFFFFLHLIYNVTAYKWWNFRNPSNMADLVVFMADPKHLQRQLRIPNNVASENLSDHLFLLILGAIVVVIVWWLDLQNTCVLSAYHHCSQVVSSNPVQAKCTLYTICDKVCQGLATGRWFFHFKYFIDKSIGLDNRLCLYKSSPTTRWNN